MSTTEKKEPVAMDPHAPETKDGAVHVNNARVCYAAKTLISEFLALFPETEYATGGVNQRNVALEVFFDCTDGPSVIADLFRSLRDDPRIEAVGIGEMDAIVHFKNSARLMDLRDPFGIAEAWEVLTEDVELDGAAEEDPDEEVWEGGDAEETSVEIQDGGGA